MKRKHADALKTVYLVPVIHSARQLGSRAWLRLKGVPMAGPKKKQKQNMARRESQHDGVWSNLAQMQSRLDLTR